MNILLTGRSSGNKMAPGVDIVQCQFPVQLEELLSRTSDNEYFYHREEIREQDGTKGGHSTVPKSH
jgi:hypothetical protein